MRENQAIADHGAVIAALKARGCDAVVLALNAPRLRQGEQRVLNVAAGKACTKSCS